MNQSTFLVACKKTLIGSVLMIGASQSFAGSAEAIDDSAKWRDYCTSTGGEVITLVAQYDTSSGTVNGLPKQFCKYVTEGNQELIGLDTLAASQPSLAATFLKSLVIDINKPLPEKPYANPALNVCDRLKGSNIGFNVSSGGFSNKDGQYDVCVFGDGSSVSSWTLTYIASGAFANVKALIKSEPLNITIPNVQLGSDS